MMLDPQAHRANLDSGLWPEPWTLTGRASEGLAEFVESLGDQRRTFVSGVNLSAYEGRFRPGAFDPASFRPHTGNSPRFCERQGWTRHWSTRDAAIVLAGSVTIVGESPHKRL